MKGIAKFFILLALYFSAIQSANKHRKSRLKTNTKQESLYKPQNLSMLIPNTSAIIDPENYVTSLNAKANLTKTLENIYKLDGFTTYVIFISNMPSNYTNVSVSDNSAFVSELANILSETTPEINLDSIIILFSIKDEVIQMRTGANVRKVISDKKAEEFIGTIKPILYTKDYGKAASMLAQSILNKIASDNVYIFGDGYAVSAQTIMIIIIVGSVVAAAILASILTYCLCKRCNRPLDDRLNRIKLLTTGEESALEYIHENCTICLEDLKGRDGLSNRLLECGHAFHKSCLQNYNSFNKNCPSCQYCKNIRSSTEIANTGFQRSLISIQSEIYKKKLNRYQLNYEYGNFSWIRHDKKEVPKQLAQEEKKLEENKNKSLINEQNTAPGSVTNFQDRDHGISRSGISNDLIRSSY